MMTPDRPPRLVSGADLFAGLDTGDIKILTADLTAAIARQNRVHGCMSELAVDAYSLLDDLHDAWRAAFDRETGAGRAAEIRAAAHRDHITAAERLLAAERAA